MSNLLSKYLPYILLLYFLACSIKRPFYLFGIPFLIFFQSCIFFDNVKIFAVPGSISKDILFLAWLAITWIVLSSRSLIQVGYKRINYYEYKGINWLDLLVIGLIAISLIDLILVIKEYLITKDVFNEFFTLISLFLGFFIVKKIICFTKPDLIRDFLYSIVVVNTIASLLYFMHQGLHITIYQETDENVQQELFQGETFTREFWFMPVLWYFSIAYLLVFRKKKALISYLLIAINFLAIFISYTRSAVGIALIVIICYFILIAYKKRNISLFLKNIIVTVFAGSVLFFVVSYFLPSKLNYFISRVNELKQTPRNDEPDDLTFRFEMTGEILHKMDANRNIIGLGPVTETQLPWVEDMRATTADMVWTGVIFRWGYVGLILFGLLYSISLVKAFRLFIKSDGVLSQLGLLFLLTLISQILESFLSWTFMNPGHFAMGLWYFGILSALIGFSKEVEPQIENSEDYQLS